MKCAQKAACQSESQFSKYLNEDRKTDTHKIKYQRKCLKGSNYALLQSLFLIKITKVYSKPFKIGLTQLKHCIKPTISLSALLEHHVNSMSKLELTCV